jgi:lipopolysaccharide transport system permease protein
MRAVGTLLAPILHHTALKKTTKENMSSFQSALLWQGPGIDGERDVAAPKSSGEPQLTIVEPRSGWHLVDLAELWRYRELLYFLVWRDIKVRYRQTVLGATWAVLQPLATMMVFTLFLGRVTAAASDAVAYPLFVFAGLLPWNFFAGAISSSGQSVVGSQNLVTKVYFPRLLIPTSAVGVSLVDFVIGLGMMAVLIIVYGVATSWQVLLVPLIMLLLLLAAVGVGTLLAALTVAYRDFRHVVPFAIQLWMFATPAIYLQADDLLSEQARALLPLNPTHGLIRAFRQAILGQALDIYALAVSSTVSIALLIVGCLYFRRVERSFADII